jgi:hypothetical protein
MGSSLPHLASSRRFALFGRCFVRSSVLYFCVAERLKGLVIAILVIARVGSPFPPGTELQAHVL